LAFGRPCKFARSTVFVQRRVRRESGSVTGVDRHRRRRASPEPRFRPDAAADSPADAAKKSRVTRAPPQYAVKPAVLSGPGHYSIEWDRFQVDDRGFPARRHHVAGHSSKMCRAVPRALAWVENGLHWHFRPEVIAGLKRMTPQEFDNAHAPLALPAVFPKTSTTLLLPAVTHHSVAEVRDRQRPPLERAGPAENTQRKTAAPMNDQTVMVRSRAWCRKRCTALARAALPAPGCTTAAARAGPVDLAMVLGSISGLLVTWLFVLLDAVGSFRQRFGR